MIRRYSVNFIIFSISMDILVVCLALLAATWIRPALAFLPFAAHYPSLIPTPLGLYFVFAIEWVAIHLLLDVYNGKRNLKSVDMLTRLSLSAILASLTLGGTIFLIYRALSRLLFYTFIILAYLAIFTWRYLASLSLRSTQTIASKPRRLLIVGYGKVGRELYAQINTAGNSHLQVAGFLDDDPTKQAQHPEILGNLDSALAWIQNMQIDDVIIALPQPAYEKLNLLVSQLLPLPVKVWVVPDSFRLALHKASIESFAGIPLLDLRAPALSDNQRLVKRAFDLVIGTLLLLLALPFMGLIALITRLESPGPLIFTQQRVGENGKNFKMFKFRSMIANAEELRNLVEHNDPQGNLVHKTADDPRVTKFGAFMRKYSLDELPQFINIIKGEMSLVGPRPELPYLVEVYEPWQRARFCVPQGLTGWWQIQGRSDKPMHLNTEDDLYYVQNYSLLLDIYILLKTVGVVLSGRGAF